MSMGRREFITLLGGAALACPVAARAQQPERMRQIGLMVVNEEGDPEGKPRVMAFRQGLKGSGWTEGRNLRIEYRWGAGPDRALAYAKELVDLVPDVIVANGTPALAALQQLTRTIPIVFVVVVDPVGSGYVRSLGRPGGNITGFSTFEPEMGTKWLQLLREMRPSLSRVAAISDPAFKGFVALMAAIESAAPTLGLEFTSVGFHNRSDNIEAAIDVFARLPDGGLIVLPTTLNNIHRERLFSVAANHRLPALYPFRHYTVDGGLMSYGFDAADLFKRGGSYVGRILKGENAADLPVQTPTKFELAINLKTAKALGLTVPATLLARADEIIE
jgi:putative ABC transport system substrate-binding protein